MPIPLKSVSHADTGASGGIARVGLETRAGANPHRSAPVKVRVAGALFFRGGRVVSARDRAHARDARRQKKTVFAQFRFRVL
jgi:hypothetical protein